MDQSANMAARLDELMAEIGWVRRLARALINDVAAADDIAQDAWLLAIRHPPTDARPLRPWLRRVVLNVARMRHRTARRRDAREAATELADVSTPAELVERVELQLGGCRSRLYGSVVDASGGSIAKARLLSAERGGTESDASGQYSLCLPAGDSRVRVEADGYGTVALPFRLFGEFHYDVVLVPEAVLVGQMVADGSRPVAGARVIATPDDIDWLHHVATGWATTDRDGRFQIAGLAPGRFRVHASADQLGMGTPQLVVARPATSSHELRLVLEGVAQVRGRVKMAGRPVSGARIIASREGAPSDAVSFSQPDGSFVLSGVPFGINVFATPPYEVRSPTSLAITRAVVDDVVLDVRAMATLRGHVIRKGEPVAGASVGCVGSPTHAKTDPSGSFVLEGLPPGDQRIYAASAEPFAFADNLAVTLAIGEDRTLDIELDRAGRAKGTVVDEDGKPVPNAYVHLEPASGDRYQGQRMNREASGESMTDAAGAFDCAAMAGGDYLPAVYPSPLAARAFAPAAGEQLEAIHVPRDGTVTGVRLAIKHERLAIRGKVVDDVGADVSDVHIQAIGRGRGAITLQSVMSDAAGRFAVGDLARSTYSLHARGADGSETEVFNVPAGSEAVTIVLGRPGAIEGTLIGFSTAPIVALQHDTPDLTTGSRAIVEGDRFSALGVPHGHYTVQAKAGVEVDGQAVEVRPGETIRLTLRSRGLGKIAGRLTEYGSKAPVTGMRCAVASYINSRQQQSVVSNLGGWMTQILNPDPNALRYWSTHDEWSKLTAAIDAGNPVPIGMGLYFNGSSSHQIVASGYRNGKREKWILAYNPNQPGREAWVHLAPGSNDWDDSEGKSLGLRTKQSM